MNNPTLESTAELIGAENELELAWNERIETLREDRQQTELITALGDIITEQTLATQRMLHHIRTGLYATTLDDGGSPRWPQREHNPTALREFAQDVRGNTVLIAGEQHQRQAQKLQQEAEMHSAVRALGELSQKIGMTVAAVHRGQQFSEQRLFHADFEPTAGRRSVMYKSSESEQVLTCTGAWGETENEALHPLAKSVSGKLLVISLAGGGERRLWAPELTAPPADRQEPDQQD